MISSFAMMTKVVYGLGSVQKLPGELEALNVRRPWIVTDPGIAAAGLLGHVQSVLQEAGIEAGTFTEVTPTAKVETVDECWRQAKEFSTDGIIALGGGSPLVIGKATGVLGGAVQNGENVDSCREFAFRAPEHVLPVLAIPTTAGSGSEVSPNLPLVDTANNRKITINDLKCYPRTAILDATLLRNLPAGIAAHSGVDALTHAIEACLTDASTPVTTAIAHSAMQMLIQNLRGCCYTGDLEAKQACLEGSFLANIACTNAKLGYVHGLARNVQTVFGLPYGLTIGVFLVPVLEFNLQAVPDRLAAMAPWLGASCSHKWDTKTQAEQAILQVKKLLLDLNFPVRFTSEQVDRSKIPLMAKMVFVRRAEKNFTTEELEALEVKGFGPNPNIRRATFEDIKKLYERSLDGWTL
jgi:alcohol dehydrogenase class IV